MHSSCQHGPLRSLRSFRIWSWILLGVRIRRELFGDFRALTGMLCCCGPCTLPCCLFLHGVDMIAPHTDKTSTSQQPALGPTTPLLSNEAVGEQTSHAGSQQPVLSPTTPLLPKEPVGEPTIPEAPIAEQPNKCSCSDVLDCAYHYSATYLLSCAKFWNAGVECERSMNPFDTQKKWQPLAGSFRMLPRT